MVAIRNWRDSDPTVAHETAIVFPILAEKGNETWPAEIAQMESILSITLHMMQAGKEGDYHDHDEKEQVYYFTQGRGKMKIDDKIYEVKEGDAVHCPPHSKHQLINDSDDWIAHLIISASVG